MKRFLIFILTAFIFGCKSELKFCSSDSKSAYNLNYEVCAIPEMEKFFELNEQEMKILKIRNENEVLDFELNRSRIEIVKFNKDTSKFSTLCECYLSNDTIIFSSGTGFMGGLLFSGIITKDKFETEYYEYTDDNKPYRKSKNEDFKSSIFLSAKHQQLFLSEKPKFKIGEQITGKVNFSSEEFYFKDYRDSLKLKKVDIEAFLTCTLNEIK